jgi:glycosyltransferase involved in cell wall biosynthesis
VEDVANAMNAMDCVLIPSLWEEALGFSALEAMSLGKPIVATKSGGLPELVVPGETGFLIEKRDSGALADAVRELSADPALAERLGKRAREIQRAEYTIEKFGERMEAVYGAAAGLS